MSGMLVGVNEPARSASKGRPLLALRAQYTSPPCLSAPQVVQHRRPGQPHGAVVVVAQAARRAVLFEGAADVVAAVDDHPPPPRLDALHLLAPPHPLRLHAPP